MTAADDYRHVVLGDVESTNLECLERARNGDAGNLWITADRQLRGRARRGRTWVSEPGNLYASLLLIDPAPMAALASLPLVAAVAVHAAIRGALPPDSKRASLKWPNDVLIDGAKVSGILLESEILKTGRQAIVVGCGINVVHAPDHPLYPATTLRAAGSTQSLEELFARLCQAMAEWLQRWDRGQGTPIVRKAWLTGAEGIGRHIVVNLPDRTISGYFRDLDMAGCLMLEDEQGHLQTIAAGDVFFD